MSRPPSTGMVLSFARGRARHLAREVVDLEFRLDVEELTTSGALRMLRPRREVLRRGIERRMQVLAEIMPELDPADALRTLIDRACRTYRARGAANRQPANRQPAPDADPELDWALALHALETAVARRAT